MKKGRMIDLKDKVLALLQEHKPRTVAEARDLVMQELELNETDSLNIIDELSGSKAIKFREPSQSTLPLPSSLDEYLFHRSPYSKEFWFVMIGTVLFLVSGLTIQFDSPLGFVRIFAVLLFMLTVPGISVTSMLFPIYGKTLNRFERLNVTVVCSLGIHMGLGFILDTVAKLDQNLLVLVETITALVLQGGAIVRRITLTTSK